MSHSSSRVALIALGIAGGVCCSGNGTSTSPAVPTAPSATTESSAVLPYGQASGDPTSCPGGSSPSTACTNLVVTCPSVPAASATLRLWPAAGTVNRGTVLLSTGGDGTAFTTNVSTLSASMIATFTSDGLSVVELAWQSPGIWGGPRARTLACRYATAARWVNEKLHAGGKTRLFAAQGTSGGASQIAFALAHYGVSDFLDLANLGGGPPGCPLCSPDGVNAPEPLLPGAPPSSNHDPLLNYPGTSVRFFLGDQEPTPDIVADANAYFAAIRSAKTFTFVANTAHNIEQTQAGVDAFTTAVHAALK
jgi:hypothetical protein